MDFILSKFSAKNDVFLENHCYDPPYSFLNSRNLNRNWQFLNHNIDPRKDIPMYSRK
jgi:hypothetical protein